jgi:very-short-patch-repair endonuclease
MLFDAASKALVELAASRHNAFHNSEAADITQRRIWRGQERGELTRLAPRVWSVTALGHPAGQALRAATLTTAGAAACHHSAGWLHGWYDHPPETSHLWVPARGRRAADRVRLHVAHGVCLHQDVTEANGIRTLGPAATLCLIGRVASDAEVERCLDAFLLIHSERWLTRTLDRLWRPNCAGPAALVRALSHPSRDRGRVESAMERVTARLLAAADLPPIELQHHIRAGGRSFRIDLAMPSIKLGVESHGRQFHWGRGVEEADNERDLMLASAGWSLLYVTWSQLQEPDRFVTAVQKAAAARSLQLRGQGHSAA